MPLANLLYRTCSFFQGKVINSNEHRLAYEGGIFYSAQCYAKTTPGLIPGAIQPNLAWPGWRIIRPALVILKTQCWIYLACKRHNLAKLSRITH